MSSFVKDGCCYLGHRFSEFERNDVDWNYVHGTFNIEMD